MRSQLRGAVATATLMFAFAAADAPFTGRTVESVPFDKVFRGGVVSDLAVDANGLVYVAGDTSSSQFVTTPDAYDRVCNEDGRCGGASDSFLMILSPDGQLLYSTLLGGAMREEHTQIALGRDGSVWIAGTTFSRSFGAQRDVAACDGFAVFLARLSADRRSLDDFRCISGKGSDLAVDLAFDRNEHLWVLGWTISPDFPVTADAWQPTLAGSSDAFLMKFTLSDPAPLYSTFIGGTGPDTPQAMVITDEGDPVVAGYTTSPDFPLVRAVQPQFMGIVDAFAVRLGASGRYLEYATYLGGSGHDVGHGVAADREGNAYIAGWTNSTDLPVTPGAVDMACGTGANCNLGDAFVASIDRAGALRFGTFMGGSESEVPRAIRISADGLIAVTGDTQSADFARIRALPTPWVPERLSSVPFLALTDPSATRYEQTTLVPVADARPIFVDAFTGDAHHVYVGGRVAHAPNIPGGGFFVRKLRLSGGAVQ